MKISKYLLLKTVIQFFLFRKSFKLYKSDVHNFINIQEFLNEPIKYTIITNNFNINDRYNYLKKKLSEDASNFLLSQTLFDILDFIVEFVRYRRITTLSHHLLATTIAFSIYKFGNTGHSLPFIIVGTNQITGVLGFNIYAILKGLKISKKKRKYHTAFMIFLQIFIRFPILLYALSTILRILLTEKIDKDDYILYFVQLIAGSIQFYNEVDWLM
tara:strand:+ start:10 stop:654 length:645 start_codon:yes stop_codon:yes gene_type:complete